MFYNLCRTFPFPISCIRTKILFSGTSIQRMDARCQYCLSLFSGQSLQNTQNGTHPLMTFSHQNKLLRRRSLEANDPCLLLLALMRAEDDRFLWIWRGLTHYSSSIEMTSPVFAPSADKSDPAAPTLPMRHGSAGQNAALCFPS